MRTFSWHDETLPRNQNAAFGRWLIEHRVDVVIWMKEEWTGAPSAAPHLGRGRTVVHGPATLVPVARQDGYGLIAYRVDGIPHRAGPSRPPPAAAGGIPTQ